MYPKIIKKFEKNYYTRQGVSGFMAEAGIEIFIATAACLALVTAIQFGERAYRFKRIKENKHAGTYGFNFETSGSHQ